MNSKIQNANSKRTLQEVRLEVDIEQVAAETLHGIVERKYVYSLAVLDVRTSVNVNDIAELDSQVVSGDLVHLNLALVDIVGAETDKNGISSLLSATRTVR